MTERGEYNQDMQYLHLTVYGKDEEWSKEYRAWRYKINEPLDFSDQQTHFSFYDGIEVKIVFETIDGQKYGQIELDYDYLGYLAEERWRDLPSARIVRRFKYKFDIIYHGEEPSAPLSKSGSLDMMVSLCLMLQQIWLRQMSCI